MLDNSELIYSDSNELIGGIFRVESFGTSEILDCTLTQKNDGFWMLSFVSVLDSSLGSSSKNNMTNAAFEFDLGSPDFTGSYDSALDLGSIF